MARYIGPKSKIARRFGEPIFGADKVLSRRNFPPGQHGNNRRRKMSEYGVMLAEKQKAKYTYGVLERQFRNMFEKAAKADGQQIFEKNVFPKIFDQTAQDSYMESTETYTQLFEDTVKYKAIMAALAKVLYRELRNGAEG